MLRLIFLNSLMIDAFLSRMKVQAEPENFSIQQLSDCYFRCETNQIVLQYSGYAGIDIQPNYVIVQISDIGARD